MRRLALQATWRVLLGMLGAVALLAGCGTSANNGGNNIEPPPSLTRRTVSGVVVNSSTAAPVPAALVVIGGSQAVSGQDGRFAVSDVERVDQALVATADGYLPRTQVVTSTSDQVNVPLDPVGAPGHQDPPDPAR